MRASRGSGNDRLIDLSALKPQPWKNGGGSTLQIAIDPTDAGLDTFSWRVSQARIESDGPFSLFPHVSRWIMLVEGNGFDLDFPGGRQAFQAGLIGIGLCVPRPSADSPVQFHFIRRGWLALGPSLSFQSFQPHDEIPRAVFRDPAMPDQNYTDFGWLHSLLTHDYEA